MAEGYNARQYPCKCSGAHRAREEISYERRVRGQIHSRVRTDGTRAGERERSLRSNGGSLDILYYSTASLIARPRFPACTRTAAVRRWCGDAARAAILGAQQLLNKSACEAFPGINKPIRERCSGSGEPQFAAIFSIVSSSLLRPRR